jgi:integrase
MSRKPYFGRNVSIADFVATYLAGHIFDRVSPLTAEVHRKLMAVWTEHLGADRRLRDISLQQVIAIVDSPWGKSVGPARINRAVNALNAALEWAQLMHYLPETKKLPTAGWLPLPEPPAEKRSFLTEQDIVNLVEAALRQTAQPTRARQMADFILLLAHSGLRDREARMLEWTDIDWANKQIVLQGTKLSPTGEVLDWTKNRIARVVPFNTRLEQHLLLMQLRRNKHSRWIFPGRNAFNFWESPDTSFEKCREAAGLPDVRIHDLRHHFASRCVMAGIDFMTIAKWMGHQDGGLLIAKVYGHINDTHSRAMADKL